MADCTNESSYIRQQTREVRRWMKARSQHSGVEVVIPTARIKHALLWLQALFTHRRGALSKTYHVPRWCWIRVLHITADASPWYGGAWFAINGQPYEWLETSWSSDDCHMLQCAIGDCRGQAVWESLIILVAMRIWLPDWGQERIKLVARSDSLAALGALGKLRSKSVHMNLIAAELALDLAEANYEVVIEHAHVKGCDNSWADALSRLAEPGGCFEVPPGLRHVRQRVVPARGRGWWLLSGNP